VAFKVISLISFFTKNLVTFYRYNNNRRRAWNQKQINQQETQVRRSRNSHRRSFNKEEEY
jgi:hypothetical protein